MEEDNQKENFEKNAQESITNEQEESISPEEQSSSKNGEEIEVDNGEQDLSVSEIPGSESENEDQSSQISTDSSQNTKDENNSETSETEETETEDTLKTETPSENTENLSSPEIPKTEKTMEITQNIENNESSQIKKEFSERTGSTEKVEELEKVDETDKVEEPEVAKEKIEKNWKWMDIDLKSGFSRLDDDSIQEILEKSKSVNPIINKMFKDLIGICADGFNFDNSRINFENYMKFYKEINRIIPTLKNKIPTDDCKNSMFFVGDTHGSIEDSFYVIDFFMRIMKENSDDKFVFVGDYVDRNSYDLQNLTLIVAFYILFQDRVTILRGNHEDKTINEYYGFVDNLLRRFYDKADELYEQILKFFMHLPIAHIGQLYNSDGAIGARIFSVHGGIPINRNDFMAPIVLKDVKDQLICEVEKSDLMDDLTVSMLWSDPDELINYIVTDDNNTGRMQFGRPVLESFLQANNLDVVVRGHQKWRDGYRIFFDYKLFSLFSTSQYDNRKKFNPKILQLQLGKSPNIISIDPVELKELADSYLQK